jgi:hypothetical protein
MDAPGLPQGKYARITTARLAASVTFESVSNGRSGCSAVLAAPKPTANNSDERCQDEEIEQREIFNDG